jgi:predicted  nucleic acid-binding Zn-ribbon protein
VARAEETLREAQDALKHLKVTIHEQEVTLKSIHQAIAKHQKQLNEAGGKKEYDALQAEIAVEKHKLQKTEDEILNSMMEVEEGAARVPGLEEAVKQAKQEGADFERTSGERQANLTAQLDQALKELHDVETHLPDDIRPQYQRLVAAKGEDSMAAAINRSCAACYTEITAQMYNDLLAGRFVLCKSCGRLLYLPE